VKFPKRIKFRGKQLAVIYRPSKSYPHYRVSWTAGGRRMMKGFRRYGEAKRHADQLVKDLAKGSQVTALTPGQANDALAALERLQGFYQSTGRRVSLLASVSEYCEAAGKLAGRPLGEAVEGFMSTVASVKRMDLGQAVEQWIESRKPKTQARDGKRPQLSPGYAYNVAMWAREFAKTFPGYAVCDLTKELFNAYMANHGAVSPKTRNERRNVIRMFIKWAERQDLLARNNRLLEADSMTREVAEPEEIQLYTPKELAATLSAAAEKAAFKPLLPVVALVALGGVRLQEATRLNWEDVWHVDGHVEISVAKSKTRARRLVTINPSLGAWLESYRSCSGPLWTQCLDHFHRAFGAMLEDLKIPARRNGLWHGFVSAHYALYSDEGLTAKESGNSPAMIHKNYKGLLTRKQAEAWFAMSPQRPATVIPLAAAPAAQESPR
jgi:integrase